MQDWVKNTSVAVEKHTSVAVAIYASAVAVTHTFAAVAKETFEEEAVAPIFLGRVNACFQKAYLYKMRLADLNSGRILTTLQTCYHQHIVT
jgi:hypothetical protein